MSNAAGNLSRAVDRVIQQEVAHMSAAEYRLFMSTKLGLAWRRRTLRQRSPWVEDQLAALKAERQRLLSVKR